MPHLAPVTAPGSAASAQPGRRAGYHLARALLLVALVAAAAGAHASPAGAAVKTCLTLPNVQGEGEFCFHVTAASGTLQYGGTLATPSCTYTSTMPGPVTFAFAATPAGTSDGSIAVALGGASGGVQASGTRLHPGWTSVGCADSFTFPPITSSGKFGPGFAVYATKGSDTARVVWSPLFAETFGATEATTGPECREDPFSTALDASTDPVALLTAPETTLSFSATNHVISDSPGVGHNDCTNNHAYSVTLQLLTGVRTSANGIRAIKDEEGLPTKPCAKGSPKRCAYAYEDQVGFCTIGVGHLIAKRTCTAAEKKIRWSLDKVDEVLREDLKVAEKKVRSLRRVLDQCQFDALVSFAFNVGSAFSKKSAVRKALLANDYAAVPAAMLKFNRAAGKVVPALTRRRKREGLMFKTLICPCEGVYVPRQH